MIRRIRHVLGHWLLRDYCNHPDTFCIPELQDGYETHECYDCGDWLLVDTIEERGY